MTLSSFYIAGNTAPVNDFMVEQPGRNCLLYNRLYFLSEHVHGTLPSECSLASVLGNTLGKVPSEEERLGGFQVFSCEGLWSQTI